jgi:hypothetical protein
MMLRAWVLTVFICAVVISALPLRVDAQEGPAGVVEEISGTAFWRRNAKAKVERLSPESDLARRLYPGEQVRCAHGSVLHLRLGGEPKTIRTTGWFTIPRLSSARLDPFIRMLDDYARPSGIDRADGIRVFSPADHSAVLIEQFVIRWRPSAAGCAFSFLIQDVEANRVWRREDVDGASGSLYDASAAQALAEYRAKKGQGPLTLVVNDSCGSTTPPQSFSLLSAEDERALKEDLAFWDKQGGTFVPHLGRASVYDRYRMFPQAADAYEAALREVPGSRGLLLRAIKAQRATGNSERAAELKKRLPAGMNVP